MKGVEFRRIDLGGTIEIDAAEHIAGVSGGGLERERDRFAGMEGLAGNRDLAGERALFHVCYVRGQGAEAGAREASPLSAGPRRSPPARSGYPAWTDSVLEHSALAASFVGILRWPRFRPVKKVLRN